MMVLGVVAFLVMAASWIQPINSAFYRITFLTGLAGTLAALLLVPRKPHFKVLVLAVIGYVGFGVYRAEPSSVDRGAFDRAWVQTALSYNGTPYRFGGESFMGMDSVGLLRRSLLVTQLKMVLRTGNPHYLKVAYTIWSSPFSLASLLQPGAGWVDFVGYYAPERDVELRAGDIFVSRSRTESAIYIGDGEVLGISPRTERVAVHALGDTQLVVFSSWAYVLRWKPASLAMKQLGAKE